MSGPIGEMGGSYVSWFSLRDRKLLVVYWRYDITSWSTGFHLMDFERESNVSAAAVSVVSQ